MKLSSKITIGAILFSIIYGISTCCALSKIRCFFDKICSVELQPLSSNAYTKTGFIDEDDIIRMFDPSFRNIKRNDYYSGWVIPLIYSGIISEKPNYGKYDAKFLWAILEEIVPQDFLYYHSEEHEILEWFADADFLCSKTNSIRVCKRLEQIKNNNQKMKGLGLSLDTSFIPQGVSPFILKTDIKEDFKNIGVLKLCVNSKFQNRNNFIEKMEQLSGLKIELFYTTSSIEGLIHLSNDVCDFAFVNSNLLHSSELIPTFFVNRYYPFILICSNITSISELTPEHTIYVGSDQLDSQYTFNNIKDVLFKNGNFDFSKSISETSILLNRDKKACVFSIDSWDATWVQRLDGMNTGKLIELPKIHGYTQGYIDKNHFENLTQDVNGGWLSHGTNTNVIQPVLVTTSLWISQNRSLYFNKILNALVALQPEL